VLGLGPGLDLVFTYIYSVVFAVNTVDIMLTTTPTVHHYFCIASSCWWFSFSAASVHTT